MKTSEFLGKRFAFSKIIVNSFKLMKFYSKTLANSGEYSFYGDIHIERFRIFRLSVFINGPKVLNYFAIYLNPNYPKLVDLDGIMI